jgi:hypothetical protein
MSKSKAELLQLPSCERIYDVDGIGEVIFPIGVDTVTKSVKIVLDNEEISPDELQSIIAANALALNAIEEVYQKDVSNKIKQQFSSILNYAGSPIILDVPFKIILSKDYFGNKISSIPDFSSFKFTYNTEKFLSDKYSAINFLKEHPTQPLVDQTSPIQFDTILSKEQLISSVQYLKISTEVKELLENSTDSSDFIEKARANGIVLEEKVQPLQSIENMISEEEFSKEEILSAYDCTNPETILAKFRSDEVDNVATQCCEPVIEEQEEFQIPIIEEPQLKTEEEIYDFIEKIEQSSLQMQKCSDEKAYADNYIEKIYQVREDLYPILFYVTKREEFFLKYDTVISTKEILKKNIDESINILNSIKNIGEKTAGSSFSNIISGTGASAQGFSALISLASSKNSWDLQKETRNTTSDALSSAYKLLTSTDTLSQLGVSQNAYKAAIVSDIEAYSKTNDFINKALNTLDSLEKDINTDPILEEKEILALKMPGSNIEDFLLPSLLLLPAQDDNNYSNQSGINPDKKHLFLLIDGEKQIFEEIKTLYEFNNFTEKLDILYKADVTINGAELSRGIIYRDVWNKYNSAERVDFLFTSDEQGYITKKPSTSDLQDTSKYESLKDIKIDDAKALNFLSTFDTQQELRLLQKIAQSRIDASNYFSSLEVLAKKEASRVYEAQILSLQWDRNDLIKAFKDTKTQYNNEYVSLSKFDLELQQKVVTLQDFSLQKKSCFAEQEKIIESLFPSSESDQSIETPGQDPFGAYPTKSTNPGPQKNCYWKEYTKHLQTVSLMPIPDILALDKRLFRYYPVGLQIRVPSPPGILPTLALGKPDTKISVPLPIIWRHIVTLTTPAGMFVLWLTYCPPYTVSPYLLFFDETMQTTFLTSPKGKVNVPAPSLKWQKYLEKSLVDRIPGLKIPMRALPPIDSNIDNNKADSTKTYIQDLRNRVKSQIDKIENIDGPLDQDRIDRRIRLNSLRLRLKNALDINSPELASIILEFVNELKQQISGYALQMLDFEPFTVPKTNSKLFGDETVNDALSLKEKILAMKKAGNVVSINTVNVGEIVKRECINILDTKEGKSIALEMGNELKILESRLLSTSIEKEVLDILVKYVSKLLEKAMKKITPKKLGWVQTPISMIPAISPFPCSSSLEYEPIPLWIILINKALQTLPSMLTVPSTKNALLLELLRSLNLSGRLPSSKDLLTQTVSSTLDIIMNLVGNAVPVPGWPNAVPYPKINTITKQVLADSQNAVFKKKLRLPPAPLGITPITISPSIIREAASGIIVSTLEATFAIIIEDLLLYANKNVEQLDTQTINKIKITLTLIKSVLGTDLWDMNEQDVRSVASSFARNTLLSVEDSIKQIMSTADVAVIKEFKSIFSQITGKISLKMKPGEPSIDIGQEIVFALFKVYIMEYVTGKRNPLPYPAILIGCSSGLPGWASSTLVNPLSALEKTPPWERLSMKNTPFVIFLDLLAATSQRYGGRANSYVIPYFTPEQ